MRRWVSTFGALLLVLMLWTGATAHAAQATHCTGPGIESAVHLEDSKDSASGERDADALHHHLGCSGHHLAAPADARFLPVATSSGAKPYDRQANLHAAEGPGLTLRPPIS